jgi:hypothetical protein
MTPIVIERFNDEKSALKGDVMVQILQLDVRGMPQEWITPEDAASYYATDSVAWTVGSVIHTLHGGTNAVTGLLSRIDVHAIVATTGASRVNLFDAVPSLSNPKLFRRDRMTCAYCGGHFDDRQLTREHIVPTAQGGVDDWLNVVAACKPCNGRKACRTPEQARMRLLFAPHAPSVFEGFLLAGRSISGDVHDWLISRVGSNSRWADQSVKVSHPKYLQ